MRGLLLLIGTILVFTSIISCTQEDTVVNPNAEELELMLKTGKLANECLGGQCMPKVEVKCTSSVISINWTVVPYNHYEHHFDFTYFVNGQYRRSTITESGSLNIPIKQSGNFALYYSLRCVECTSTRCFTEKSINIKNGALTHEEVDYADCFKEYLQYQINFANNKLILIPNNGGHIYDKSKYMEFNAANIYDYSMQQTNELVVFVDDTSHVVEVQLPPLKDKNIKSNCGIKMNVFLMKNTTIV